MRLARLGQPRPLSVAIIRSFGTFGAGEGRRRTDRSLDQLVVEQAHVGVNQRAVVYQRGRECGVIPR